MARPTTLTHGELEKALKRLTPRGAECGAARIVRRLAFTPKVRTRSVNQDCAVGNISEQVRSMVNPRIRDMDLFVACEKPLRPFQNRFGQTTGEHLWSLYRLSDEDEDDDLAEAFRNDLDELLDEHPDALDRLVT